MLNFTMLTGFYSDTIGEPEKAKKLENAKMIKLWCFVDAFVYGHFLHYSPMTWMITVRSLG